MEIRQPYCDWIAIKHRDKRRGSMWLCKECGHHGMGKSVPKCPCKPINIPPPDLVGVPRAGE
jgi:hypothetical protein